MPAIVVDAGDAEAAGRCAAGGPLRLGDKVYPRGIGVNSQSTLRVELDRAHALRHVEREGDFLFGGKLGVGETGLVGHAPV